MLKLKTNTQKIKLDDIKHGVRASQLVTNYGPGSLVEFPEQTLITAAPEYWARQVIHINDPRLAKLLKVDYFGIPTSDKTSHFDGVSYIQFPEWYSCPRCHKFQPVKKWIIDYQHKSGKSKDENLKEFTKRMRCADCNAPLIVSRIVVACENGHIDDFPWVDWAHARNLGGPVKVCSHPALKLSSAQGGAEGLESIEVACSCGAKARLGGAFGKNVFQGLQIKYGDQYNFRCSGRHPWKFSHCDCKLYPRTMNRGSSALYFPVNIPSIVIPPYSSFILKRVDESKALKDLQIEVNSINKYMSKSPVEDRQSAITDALKEGAHNIALEIGAKEDQVLDLLVKKWSGIDEDASSQTEDGYKAEEYKALNGEFHYSDGSYLDDFQRENTDVSKYGLPFLKGVSLVNKIREVVAITGFTRINPIGSSIDQRNNSAIVPVKEPETNWYPAYQVYGEGIFLEFDERFISSWILRNPDVSARAEFIQHNYDTSFFGAAHKREITPKLLLLHTLSHLLIKQLSFECGYGISSLKERIYCSDNKEHSMAGILIYTANGDSEGTLGGLVRQGRHDLFPAIFKKAVESAQLCSNDPVCSLSNGQGRDNLNLAACHSCTLIPETGCEYFNGLLDRGVVVGTMQKESLGFFSPYIRRGWDSGPLSNGPTDDYKRDSGGSDEAESGKKAYMIEMLPDTGSVGTSWADVWQSLLNYASTEQEKDFLKRLISKVGLFSGKERPIQDAEIMVIGVGEEFTVDLLWKDSRVIYLSKGNEDAYQYLNCSDWECIKADNTITPVLFANKIKDRKDGE